MGTSPPPPALTQKSKNVLTTYILTYDIHTDV